MHEINVNVTKYADRKYWIMYHRDSTGKKITRSTKKTNERDANREAAKWEAELREGRYRQSNNITWVEFRDRYEAEGAPKSDESLHKIWVTFRLVEQIIKPVKLTDVNAEAISRWIAKMHTPARSLATVAVYCRHLRAALNWAVDVEMLPEAPKMRIPRKDSDDRHMKGRPIVLEEHERIMEAVNHVVKSQYRDLWRFYLETLWWGGLRIGEALRLSWDPQADAAVWLTPGHKAAIRFLIRGHKAKRSELMPLAPQFAAMLESVPEADRVGRVFNLRFSDAHPGHLSQNRVMRIHTAISRRANVYVDGDVPATAHDYRRAFGTRWAKLVMPAVLKRMMRHKTIDTTMKYYVEHDAEDIATQIYAAHESSANLGVSTLLSTPPDITASTEGATLTPSESGESSKIEA